MLFTKIFGLDCWLENLPLIYALAVAGPHWEKTKNKNKNWFIQREETGKVWKWKSGGQPGLNGQKEGKWEIQEQHINVWAVGLSSLSPSIHLSISICVEEQNRAVLLSTLVKRPVPKSKPKTIYFVKSCHDFASSCNPISWPDLRVLSKFLPFLHADFYFWWIFFSSGFSPSLPLCLSLSLFKKLIFVFLVYRSG